MEASYQPRVGDIVPNPYDLLTDWKVVSVNGRDVEVEWPDGSRSWGYADGILQRAYSQRELAADYRAVKS